MRHRHAAPQWLPALATIAWSAAYAAVPLALLVAGFTRPLQAQSAGADRKGESPAGVSRAESVERDTVPVLVYSVNRTPEPPFETARAVTVVTRAELQRTNARTLPEALMEEVGLFVQQTDYGAGSPIIRGQMGKQILVLIDGIRVNNATFRFGPVQYLATIDINMVERIEIVRGVGSVLGSDAIGGIINVVTKRAESGAAAGALHSRLFSRHSSADRAVTGRAELSGATARYRFTSGVTGHRSGDLRAGRGVGRQRATGYDEGGANASLEYFLSNDRSVVARYQIFQQNEVPRTDRIANGANLVYDYDPQRLQLGSVRYSDQTVRSWSDFLQVTAFWNRQDEQRREIQARTPTIEQRFSDVDPMVGANIELGSSLGASHQLVYGVDYTSERIESRRTDTDLQTGSSVAKRGQLTDGAGYQTGAIYLQDRFDLTSRVTPTIGLRYSGYRSTGMENTSSGALNIASTHAHLTASANLLVRATKHVHLTAGIVSGFRAPNLDDLSVFERRTTGTEVPNTRLEPERALAYEGGVKYASGKFSGSAFYYNRRLTDLIVRDAGTFRGLPFIDDNRNGARDAGEGEVFQRRNLGSARIRGTEIDVRYSPRPSVTLFGNHAVTIGDDTRLDIPLARIPPVFGTLGARWSPAVRRQPWLRVSYSFANAQRRLNPADVADSRIGPGGTDRFDVITVRSGFLAAQRIPVTIAVENVTDERYKYHLSGVSRPGRQFVLGAAYGF